MGGKTWSDQEEDTFWGTIVPLTGAAANANPDKLKWDEAAKYMQELMGTNARRTYTGTMLYEHHYQSARQPAKPGKAKQFAEESNVENDGNGDGDQGETKPTETGENQLSEILANDPSAKRYLENKGMVFGRGNGPQLSVSTSSSSIGNTANTQGTLSAQQLSPSSTSNDDEDSTWGDSDEDEDDDHIPTRVRDPDAPLSRIAPAPSRPVVTAPSFGPIELARAAPHTVLRPEHYPRGERRRRESASEDQPLAKRQNSQMGHTVAALDSGSQQRMNHWERMGFTLRTHTAETQGQNAAQVPGTSVFQATLRSGVVPASDYATGPASTGPAWYVGHVSSDLAVGPPRYIEGFSSDYATDLHNGLDYSYTVDSNRDAPSIGVSFRGHHHEQMGQRSGGGNDAGYTQSFTPINQRGDAKCQGQNYGSRNNVDAADQGRN